ncbi:MAG TPA: Swt1 family HEPN domain-containing protein [Acidimicrobiales bacterium]|nr:Swt1 family HEPN domain-containing protein [Acidimicrobiales bacterium]
MAVSNRERVGRAFEALAEGLGPFVDRQMASVHGEAWLESFVESGPRSSAPGSLRAPAFLLKVMAEAWDSAFRTHLTRSDRNVVFELRDVRNRWAHNEAFNADDTYRALDSIERLLVAVDAKEADAVGRAKTELMRLRYEADVRKAAAPVATTSGALSGLRPWREVIVPHDDVAQGRYGLAEFAADLHQVATRSGRAEYADPVEFFRRTYLTEGLRQLLSEAAKRLAGIGGVPVVDLQTTFGGGKTHTLIALWHLCSGVPLSELPEEVQELVRAAGVDTFPKVRRAALVGTRIAPGQVSVKPDGTEVATLWGELAWQLAGKDGYELVAEADRTGTSPAGALAELFEAVAPCLVLVDEWVAYARQLYATDEHLVGGSFEAHMSFAQALTEAARSADQALLVVSLPASVSSDPSSAAPGSGGSSVELGGPGGAEALRRLRSVIGRVESSWRPASAEEGFEIVRRRLFRPIDPAALVYRDATARAFAESYRAQASEFPAECREAAYERRLRAAYPIHPELFDRLYEDWSTLERFQRTRGVLRLMAQVVGALWRGGDQSPLILPGTIPLDDAPVASELARNLEDSWKPVMDADVDGPASLPAQLDATYPNLGRYGATRKVARAVFLGSAPTVHSPHRGIEAARVRLGCAAPGEAVATYADALARLSDQATYLYVDRDRYWYGLSPSVARMARDRAERWLATGIAEVDAALCERIRRQRDRGELAGVHVAPQSSADVDDDDQVRLIVLPPEAAHVAKTEDSPALGAAREILEQRGSAPRLYRNMVVFLAADHRRVDDLRQGMAEALAWGSIAAESDELGLGAQQAAQAATKAQEAEATVERRLAETYTWALVPTQPEPTGPIVFDPVRIEGQGTLAARTARRLIDKGHLNVVYAPSLLRTLVLGGPLASLWESGHVSVGELWEALARYPYLPRLRDRLVLERSVQDGPAGFAWTEEGFALAEGYDTVSGRYLGLVVGPGGSSGTSPSTLLVRPEVAMAQLRVQEQATSQSAADAGTTETTSATRAPTDALGTSAATPSRPRRFHGSVVLRSERLNLEFGRVVQEVVQHFVDSAATVEVTVEISASSEGGFDEAIIRTVTENARTLHFREQGFEEQ